jgi:hypothetical protein
MDARERVEGGTATGAWLEAWLEERSPRVPPAFLPLLLEDAGPVGANPEGLTELGERALLRSLETPGRKRPAAFHLLAGDAFVTYACELLADGADVGVRLGALLERLGARLR